MLELNHIYGEGGVTADLGVFLTLGEGLGGGGGSVLSTDGEGFGVGDSRWFAFLFPFLLPGAELFALSLDPNCPDAVPGTTLWLAFAFALRLKGLTDGRG